MELKDFVCKKKGCGITWRASEGTSPYCSAYCKHSDSGEVVNWVKNDRMINPYGATKIIPEKKRRTATMRQKIAAQATKEKQNRKKRITGEVGKRYTKASNAALDKAVETKASRFNQRSLEKNYGKSPDITKCYSCELLYKNRIVNFGRPDTPVNECPHCGASVNVADILEKL